MNLESMYQEIILDHYRNPQHAGLRQPFDTQVHHVNPTCGDEITLRIRLRHDDDAVIEDIGYQAQGCSISQAATSVMTDLVIGQPLGKALGILDEFVELMHGQGRVSPDEDVLGDAVAFAGVAQYPARVKCALLGWMAMKDAAAAALDHSSVEEKL